MYITGSHLLDGCAGELTWWPGCWATHPNSGVETCYKPIQREQDKRINLLIKYAISHIKINITKFSFESYEGFTINKDKALMEYLLKIQLKYLYTQNMKYLVFSWQR